MASVVTALALLFIMAVAVLTIARRRQLARADRQRVRERWGIDLGHWYVTYEEAVLLVIASAIIVLVILYVMGIGHS